MKILSKNKFAHLRYQLRDKFEAGLILTGAEVKAVKSGQVNLGDAYVKIFQNSQGKFEAWLLNAHIAKFKNTIEKNYDPGRIRKLLLKKAEIKTLIGKSTQGLQIIPLSLYLKKHLIKLEFALASAKTKYDKRETIKKREQERRLSKLVKNKLQ